MFPEIVSAYKLRTEIITAGVKHFKIELEVDNLNKLKNETLYALGIGGSALLTGLTASLLPVNEKLAIVSGLITIGNAIINIGVKPLKQSHQINNLKALADNKQNKVVEGLTELEQLAETSQKESKIRILHLPSFKDKLN